VIALLNAGTGVEAATPPPAEVTGVEISVLVRSTVVALDQANRTGNYSVLHDLGDGSFQNAYSQAALADMFRAFRDQNVALNSVVLFDAQLDAPPQLTQDGYLHLLGHFPTTPNEVIFDITYRYEDGPWRIDGLNVGMRKPLAAEPPAKQVSQLLPPAAAPFPAPRPKWRDDFTNGESRPIQPELNDEPPALDEGM
jgi:hypothetical protein